jgi:Na+/H+ antiporter NhaD/arsenite permease-like protein
LGPAARRREDQKVIPLFQVFFLSFSPSLVTVFSLSVHLQRKERKIRKKKKEKEEKKEKEKEKEKKMIFSLNKVLFLILLIL